MFILCGRAARRCDSLIVACEPSVCAVRSGVLVVASLVNIFRLYLYTYSYTFGGDFYEGSLGNHTILHLDLLFYHLPLGSWLLRPWPRAQMPYPHSDRTARDRHTRVLQTVRTPSSIVSALYKERVYYRRLMHAIMPCAHLSVTPPESMCATETTISDLHSHTERGQRDAAEEGQHARTPSGHHLTWNAFGAAPRASLQLSYLFSEFLDLHVRRRRRGRAQSR